MNIEAWLKINFSCLILKSSVFFFLFPNFSKKHKGWYAIKQRNQPTNQEANACIAFIIFFSVALCKCERRITQDLLASSLCQSEEQLLKHCEEWDSSIVKLDLHMQEMVSDNHQWFASLQVFSFVKFYSNYLNAVFLTLFYDMWSVFFIFFYEKQLESGRIIWIRIIHMDVGCICKNNFFLNKKERNYFIPTIQLCWNLYVCVWGS